MILPPKVRILSFLSCGRIVYLFFALKDGEQILLASLTRMSGKLFLVVVETLAKIEIFWFQEFCQTFFAIYEFTVMSRSRSEVVCKSSKTAWREGVGRLRVGWGREGGGGGR